MSSGFGSLVVSGKLIEQQAGAAARSDCGGWEQMGSEKSNSSRAESKFDFLVSSMPCNNPWHLVLVA